METIVSLMLGLGLSAACGFRIFVPLLVMSIAAHTGNLNLATGFEWIGTFPAMVMFGVATVLEVAGYYIPWFDEMLDLISTPSAVIAGTITTASVVADVNPMMQWALALIVGGGAAGAIQGMTDVARLTSTISTGGLANPVLSTMELGSATVLSSLAIALPVLTGVLVLGIVVYAIARILKFFRKRPPERS